MIHRMDNFYEIFDIDTESEKILRRLKFGYTGREEYDIIYEALQLEPLEIQTAIWAEIDQYRIDLGYELEEDYLCYRNKTLCENFAEKFGWNREQLIDRLVG